MINLILFLLASAGLTTILIDSSIVDPLRTRLEKVLPTKLYSMFQCYQCMGFWTGVVCGSSLLFETPLIQYTSIALMLSGIAFVKIPETWLNIDLSEENQKRLDAFKKRSELIYRPFKKFHPIFAIVILIALFFLLPKTETMQLIACGAAGSVASVFLTSILTYLEARSIVSLNDLEDK